MTARRAAWMVLVAVRAVGAQSPREIRVEAGAAELRQLGRDARAAFVLNSSWRQSDTRLASIVSGGVTWARDSVAALQGIAALVWRPAAESRFLTEGGATGAAFGISNIGRGGNVSTFVRQRVLVGDGGFWGGAAFGSSVRDELVSHATGVDVGAFGRLGDVQATVSLARQRTDDWPLFEAAGIYLNQQAASYDINDATVALHYESGRLALDASHVWRNGVRATDAVQSALFATAAWTVSRRIAVAVSAGRQLADPVRGTPDARIASALVRLTWATTRDPDAMPGTASFARIVPTDGGAIVYVHVTAPDSALVSVAGTFSGWDPVQLSRVSDGWEATVFLRPGRYRVAVRIDRGPWRSPGNLAKMKDEFGGENGMIIVP